MIDPIKKIETLLQKVATLQDKAEFEKSLPLLEEIWALETSNLPPRLRGWLFFEMGLNLSWHFKYEESRSFFQKANELRQQYPTAFSNEMKGKIVFYLGEVANSLGDYTLAVTYLTEAMSILSESVAEEVGWLSSTYNNLGFLYGKLGDYFQQLEYHQLNLPLRERLYGENHTKTGISYNNLGISYCYLGDFNKAMDYFLKAIAIQQKVLPAYHEEFGRLFNNVAYCFDEKGDYDQALLYYHKALEVRTKAFPRGHGEILQNKMNIATTYNDKGELDSALAYFKQMLSDLPYLKNKSHFSKNHLYREIAQYYIKKGDREKQLFYLQKAMDEVVQDLENQQTELCILYWDFGQYYFSEKDYLNAEEYYLKSLNYTQQYYPSKHDKVASDWHTLTFLYSEQAQHAKALDMCQKALIAIVYDFDKEDVSCNPSLENAVVPIRLLQVLVTKAQLLFKCYTTDSKYADYLALTAQTIDLVDQLTDQIRNDFRTDGAKLLLSAKANKLYDLAMDVVWTQWEQTDSTNKAQIAFFKEKLFFYTEKSKSLVLLQNLQESKAKIDGAIPANMLAKEKELRLLLHTLQKQINRKKNRLTLSEMEQGLLSEWQNTYFDSYQEYEQLIELFEKEYPDYHQLKYEVQTVKCADIQAHIGKKTACIEFFTGNQFIYILTISAQQYDIHRIEKSANFEKIIKQFLRTINQLNKKQYIQLAAQLYDDLLKKPLSNLGQNITHLLLIPDNALLTIPFESLLRTLSENSDVDYTNLDYLLRTYAITYHYSTTLWLNGKQRATNKRPHLDNNFIGFAPIYKDIAAPGAADSTNEANTNELKVNLSTSALRSVKIGGKVYQALLYSEQEVSGIQQAFRQKKYPAEILLHHEATKTRFTESVKNKKYVLIAAHGVYNKKQPERSGIVFSPDTTQTEEDGLFYISDAYHLELDAELLVLSSCESGIGKMAKGEGMMAINRGFLYAGANNVIFTLFKIYDEQSSLLTQRLFDYILTGKTYTEALRQAKLDLIAQADFAPKAWAGFVLLGV